MRFNDPFDCAYDIVFSELSRVDCVKLLARASEGQVTETHVAHFDDDQLRQQVATGLKEAAHALKGSVGNFDPTQAFEAVRRLETLGRENNLTDAPAGWRVVEMEIARLSDVLRHVKKKL